VVLTGGGAQLPGSVELAQEVFGTAARVGLPTRLGGLVEEYRRPEIASAVGLVMYGARFADPQAREGAAKDGPRSGIFTSMRQWFRNFFE